jgi:hypothetical protein
MDNFTFALWVFLIAFPFGFWRVKTAFRSRDWMLAIHIPVIIIILLRIYNKRYYNIGFSWESVGYNIVAFFTAQYLAGKIYKWYIKNKTK